MNPPSRAEVDTPHGTLGTDIPHSTSDTPSGEENQHIRERVDPLRQWADYLRHAHDRATIIQKEAINQLTSVGNDSAAIAAAVSSTLEQADRIFHDQATPLDADVAAEMAAWINVISATIDPTHSDDGVKCPAPVSKPERDIFSDSGR